MNPGKLLYLLRFLNLNEGRFGHFSTVPERSRFICADESDLCQTSGVRSTPVMFCGAVMEPTATCHKLNPWHPRIMVLSLPLFMDELGKVGDFNTQK